MSDTHNLSPPQLATLAQMRSHFECVKEGYGLPLTDMTFLRYLRARNFNFNKASAMLTATLKWRREFGFNEMNNWMEVVRRENSTGKMYCRGYDKFGHTVLYLKAGQENSKDHDGIIKHLVYNVEKSVQAGLVRNPPEWKILLVIDFKGFNTKLPMRTALEVNNIMGNHYPETLCRAYFVNAPWIFHMAYNMIKPFVDPVTLEKAQMVSGSVDHIREVLTRDIDPTVLEREYGGLDGRPFVSEKYLNAPFSQDYYVVLSTDVNKDSDSTIS